MSNITMITSMSLSERSIFLFVMALKWTYIREIHCERPKPLKSTATQRLLVELARRHEAA
jgi:hypothetical protein